MKLIKVIELYKKLNSVKRLSGRELNYTIEKNISKLQFEIDLLSKTEKEISEITKEFNDELEKLRIAAATVNGVLRTKETANGVSIFDFQDSNLPGLEKDILELKELHKTKLEEQKKANEEYLKMLEENECDFKISKIKLHCIPEDISSDNMKLIFDIIQDKEQ